MAFTTIDVDSGAILASDTMQALQDNFQAIASADSGAPQVNSASLAAASMTFDNLAWGMASMSGTLSGTADPFASYTPVDFTLNAHALMIGSFITKGGVADAQKERFWEWYFACHPTEAQSAGQPRFSLKKFQFAGCPDGSYYIEYRYLP